MNMPDIVHANEPHGLPLAKVQPLASRWIAIASFPNPTRLTAALCELTEAGHEVERLCLVGTRARIDALRQSPARLAIGPVLAIMTDVHMAGLEGALLATPRSFAVKSDGELALPADMLRGVRNKVKADAALLLVEICDLQNLTLVTQVLLRHSFHQVQIRQLSNEPRLPPVD